MCTLFATGEIGHHVREEIEFVRIDRIDDAHTAAIPELAERLNRVGIQNLGR